MLSLSVSQDPTMAQMKAANPLPDHTPGSVIRGRNNYNALGVLRTKPGRADSDPTISMSCSDKIALWTLVGIQGALGTAMIRPVYLDSIVVGDVPLEMLDATKAECQRAFCERLKNVDGKQSNLFLYIDQITDSVLIPGLAHPFIAYTPRVEFTSLTFSDSRTQMPDNAVSCPECEWRSRFEGQHATHFAVERSVMLGGGDD